MAQFRRPPLRPSWTDDPVRDAGAYQEYLEKLEEYDPDEEYDRLIDEVYERSVDK